jgi:hypothetical protein
LLFNRVRDESAEAGFFEGAKMIRFRAFLLIAAAAALQPAAAQLPEATRIVAVAFVPGASGAHYEGRLVGYEVVDYLLPANRGQRLNIRFSSRNGESFFNLYGPGDGEALHDGTISGGTYDQALPVNGSYRIRVYLRANYARRGDASRHMIDINLTGAVAAGPEYWSVDGVGTGGLLIFHETPSTTSRGVGSAADGNVLRNFGCRAAEGRQWCRVGSLRNTAVTGWVDASFLRPAARPGGSPPPPKR